MTELKDVVQELVEKTESGELEWSANNEGHCWHITQQDCSFTVSPGIAYLGGAPRLLILCYDEKRGLQCSGHFSHDDVVPLTECLTTKFPFVETTPSDVLAAALACLTEE